MQCNAIMRVLFVYKAVGGTTFYRFYLLMNLWKLPRVYFKECIL